MRAGEFAIRVLGWDGGALCGAIDAVGNRSRATGDTRQNATTALRAHDLRAWRFLGSVRRTICAVHVRAHAPLFAIGVAKGTGWHAVEIATVARGSRSNRLRVTLCRRGRRQHARRRRRVGLRGVCLEKVRTRLHGRRLTTDSRVRHDRGRRGPVHVVRRRGKPTQIRPVRLAHVGMRRRRLRVMRLERRQRVRLRDRVLRLHRVLRHGHTRDWG